MDFARGPTGDQFAPRGWGDEGIAVRGIRLDVHIGWDDAEREVTRPILVDVWTPLALGASGQTDDLADTLDYRAIADAVVGVARGRSFRLIEALGHEVALAILAVAPSLLKVAVRVTKPSPPLAGAPLSVDVTLVRERDHEPA